MVSISSALRKLFTFVAMQITQMAISIKAASKFHLISLIRFLQYREDFFKKKSMRITFVRGEVDYYQKISCSRHLLVSTVQPYDWKCPALETFFVGHSTSIAISRYRVYCQLVRSHRMNFVACYHSRGNFRRSLLSHPSHPINESSQRANEID